MRRFLDVQPDMSSLLEAHRLALGGGHRTLDGLVLHRDKARLYR